MNISTTISHNTSSLINIITSESYIDSDSDNELSIYNNDKIILFDDSLNPTLTIYELSDIDSDFEDDNDSFINLNDSITKLLLKKQ